MIRFWSICRNTFVQTIRQPIFGVLLMVTFLILVLSLPLSTWTMGEKGGDYQVSDQKMLIQLGLGSLLFTGLLLAAFSASSAVSREIEDRTALTVVSKPVSRATFVMGKFAGVAAAVAIAIYLASLVFLMTVRHQVMSSVSDPYDWPVIVLGCSAGAIALIIATAGNIHFGWAFISSLVWSLTATLTVAMGSICFVGKGWAIVPFGQGIGADLLLAILAVFLAIFIIVAIAITSSTRFGQVVTLLICLAVLVVGSMYAFVFSNWANRIVLVKITAPLLPNLTYFYLFDALMQEKPIALSDVGRAAAYCALYVAGVLCLGLALFQRRSLHADSGSTSMPGPMALLAWIGRIGALVPGLIGIEGFLSYLTKTADKPAMPDKAFIPVAYAWLADAFTPGYALLGAGLLVVLSVAFWLLWTYFGHGTRWAFWTVLVLAAIDFARGVLGLAAPKAMAWAGTFGGHGQTGPLLTHAILAALVLAVVLLPSTRRNYRKA